jgi:hypothetical protein
MQHCTMPPLQPHHQFSPMSDKYHASTLSLHETGLEQLNRANMISAQMRGNASHILPLHMQDEAIFCPYQNTLPPSSCRLSLWWSVACPAPTNDIDGTSVLLFLGQLRAHGGLPPLSRIERRVGADRTSQWQHQETRGLEWSRPRAKYTESHRAKNIEVKPNSPV